MRIGQLSRQVRNRVSLLVEISARIREIERAFLTKVLPETVIPLISTKRWRKLASPKKNGYCALRLSSGHFLENAVPGDYFDPNGHAVLLDFRFSRKHFREGAFIPDH